MVWKIAVASSLAILGVVIIGFNLYLGTQPPSSKIEKTVLLAGQDLPADVGLIGLDKISKTGESNPPPPVLVDKITAEKYIPADTITITDKGDNLLVVVNKSVRLSEAYFPKDLVSLDDSIQGSVGMKLRKEAAEKILKLFNDSKKKGYKLNVNSSYRSYQTQVVTYNYWVSQVGKSEADRFSARPGHSQHQLGTTVDITSDTVDHKLLAVFGDTPEGKWLDNNAYKYGFVLAYPAGYEEVTGYTYEPWHFRYIGVINAQKWKASGKILELYLQELGVS